jgi:hypothetical protein
LAPALRSVCLEESMEHPTKRPDEPGTEGVPPGGSDRVHEEEPHYGAHDAGGRWAGWILGIVLGVIFFAVPILWAIGYMAMPVAAEWQWVIIPISLLVAALATYLAYNIFRRSF